jgi:hypothetical protein
MKIFRKIPLDRIMFRFPLATHQFTDYFKGYEKAKAVRQLFGERTESVLQNLKIQFFPLGGYMGVSNTDGHIRINPRYLNSDDRIDIHLDVIHELVHVKQHMEGKELFDTNYGYVDRPTEVEAYRYAVEEARRLGLDDERICEYLKTEWMSTNDLYRLAKTLNVQCITQP